MKMDTLELLLVFFGGLLLIFFMGRILGHILGLERFFRDPGKIETAIPYGRRKSRWNKGKKLSKMDTLQNQHEGPDPAEDFRKF